MEWENKTKEQAGTLTPSKQLPRKATLNYSSDNSETAQLKSWNQGLAEVGESFIVDFSRVKISSRGMVQKQKNQKNQCLGCLHHHRQTSSMKCHRRNGKMCQQKSSGKRGHLLSYHVIQLEMADKLASLHQEHNFFFIFFFSSLQGEDSLSP